MGAPLNLTISTNPDGSYSFANIPTGTYTLSEEQPTSDANGNDYLDGFDYDNAGARVDGSDGSDLFENITLLDGWTLNYTFTEQYRAG